MKKIIKSMALILISISTITSCSSDSSTQVPDSAPQNFKEKSAANMMITDLYTGTSSYLKSYPIKESLKNTYHDMYREYADTKSFDDSYALTLSKASYYLQNQNTASQTRIIIDNSASELIAIAEFDKLIADPKLSTDLLNEYITIRETIVFLDNNESNLTTMSDDCGWWQSWGKCTASIVSGALFGAGGGCLGGAQVGALVTSPTGPGAAGGAAAGCVIGAVGGAIAGGLGGAVAGCDGCD